MPHASVENACPQEEDIAAFIRGALAGPRKRTLEAHVARCSDCRELLSAFARAATVERPALDSISPTLPREPSANDTELQAGARFGRYVVLEFLGAGGMGVVYSAYDPELNRRVALKVLRNDDPGRVDRLPTPDLLLAEAQAMAQLAHPNVVTVFDVGRVDGRVFIAMEQVEGHTLAAWLRLQPRTRSEVLAVFLAAGNGLAAAHEAGLIHRDFKPDNVLVGNDGRVRVTDFGLARPSPRVPLGSGSGEATGSDREASAPRTGVAGTLAYMAPEQFLRVTADARSDQFSFAVALYEALYGERPFTSPPEITEGELRWAPIVSPRGAGVPASLRRVLLRALSPEPDDRYPSLAAFLAALAPRPRRARRIAVGAIIVVAVALATAGGQAIRLRRSAEERIEMVSRLRSLAPELRTQLRGARMLPLHDIRPARDKVQSAMRDVERQRQTRAGQEDGTVFDFVLGEGYRALGDHERALGLLEAAWEAGERGPQIDVALGHTLGASYWSHLEQIDNTMRADERDAEIRRIEKRYRDPAMNHLRAALVEHATSPAYLLALIALHEHRFADASRGASAAFAESPTFYEAGMLEATAHHEAGRALLAASREDGARQEFALARRIFERVLEIARSDDDAWLRYARMVFLQAHDLGSKGLPPDLRQRAIEALSTVRRINPDRWEAILSEVEIYEYEANLAIAQYRDPRPQVDKVLAMADQARAHGADADQVDTIVCRARWEQAVYERTHGLDPRPAFSQALAACERAGARKADANHYASLGVLHATVATYEGDHGGDPARSFELAEQSFRASLAITDDAVQHYNLGRLWSTFAHYESSHGRDPGRMVDAALAELDTAVRMDATRSDALAAMGDVLIARARFEQAGHRDAQPTITQGRAALDRALAIDAELLPPIKYRIELAELEAEARLERGVDPTPLLRAMRSDARALLSRHRSEGFAHRMLCHAEILAARWALAHGEATDRSLAQAATEAARAREADPTDSLAWIASAEVEQVRAEAAGSRRFASEAAVTSGLAFVERAMKIDPGLVGLRKVRDALVGRTTGAAGDR